MYKPAWGRKLSWKDVVFLLLNEYHGYFILFRYVYLEELIPVSRTWRKKNILRQVTGIETEDPRNAGWSKNAWSSLLVFHVSWKIFLWWRLKPPWRCIKRKHAGGRKKSQKLCFPLVWSAAVCRPASLVACSSLNFFSLRYTLEAR